MIWGEIDRQSRDTNFDFTTALYGFFDRYNSVTNMQCKPFRSYNSL